MERYQFRITNLDCAMCAKEVEERLQKLEWVSSASVNFNTEKIVVVTQRKTGVYEEIRKSARAVEPECDVLPLEQDGAQTARKRRDPFLPIFLVGVAAGTVGVCLDNFTGYWLAAAVLMWTGGLLMLGKTLMRAIMKIVRAHSVDENLLMAVSVIGALAIDQGFEGLMIILLYQIGKFFEQKAVDKTRNSVKSLMLVKPKTVSVRTDDGYVDIPIGEVEKGSLIQVRPGEIVPLDGVVESGECALDTSSLTGESLPLELKTGDAVMAGAVDLDGLVEIRTTGVDSDSTITRILSLIETASERKAKSETVVSRVAKYYVPAVVAIAAIVALAFGLSGMSVADSLYRGMVFLVVSCPCAVAISVPLSYFCGIGNASSNGILVKGTNFLDNVSNIKLVSFDKTGTVTTGCFSVVDIVTEPGCSKEEALRLAYLGERGSTHPIAKAIVAHASENAEKWNESAQPINVREEAGKGVSYTLRDRRVEIGRACGARRAGATSVQVSVDGKPMAVIYMSDTLKPGAKEAVAYLRSRGIATRMLTGDNAEVAAAIAEDAGIDGFQAGMLPEDKFGAMEEMLAAKKKKTDMVAYAGDGINDAPVLGRADIGIAMGLSGSAATVDAADVVLMNDDLRQLTVLHKLSGFTRRIVAVNVTATLAVKLLFMCLGVAGITGLAWAVFADVGLTICTVLNALRVLRFKPKL